MTSTRVDNKLDFSKEDFQRGLAELDVQVGLSKNLRKIAPLTLLAAGGFVAVSLFGNRDSTGDVDYFLDPRLHNQGKVEEKLQTAIVAVAKKLAYDPSWINSSVAVYAIGDARNQLFERSLEQDVVLWKGKNLVIYATQWEWTLAQKLKRLTAQPREIDLSDSVELLKRLVDKNAGQPLSRAAMKSWTTNIYTPIEDAVLDRLAAAFVTKYAVSGVLDANGAPQTS